MLAAPAAIGAVTLVVDDLDAARTFYATVFGAPEIYRDDVSTVFRFGPTMVNLLFAPAAAELVDPAPVGAAHSDPRAVYTIDVANVDEVCAQLAEAGVELLNGPMDRPWGIRTASLRDPSGHVWEFAQPIAQPLSPAGG